MSSIHQLALALSDVRAQSGRNKKVEILVALLQQASPSHRAELCYYLCGELPTGRIGVGPSLVSRLAEERPAPSSDTDFALQDLSSLLLRVKLTVGPGSKKAKWDLLYQALADLSGPAQSYFLRLLGGGLRQGALSGVLEIAVARATQVDSGLLRRAVTLLGSLPAACELAFQGSEVLKSVRMEVFTPLAPMLAATAESVKQAFQRWEESYWELKLDGARIQVHREGEQVRVYSRALRDVTASVPEVVELALSLPAERFILDGEVLSFREDGRPSPFQLTMRRFGRNGATQALRDSVPLTPHFFDLLLWDDTEFLDFPYAQRRLALERLVGKYAVEVEKPETLEEARAFVERAHSGGFEGVMIKAPEGGYEAGKRGRDWLKLKPHHTLDLAVLACEWGSGRRKGWLSNLHLGARGEDGQFVMLGKTFKGLTDETLAWQTEELLKRKIRSEGNTVWVEPSLVVEIAFNDLQESPQYPGGLALRFARVRGYRADKTPHQVDTMETVRQLHQKMTS